MKVYVLSEYGENPDRDFHYVHGVYQTFLKAQNAMEKEYSDAKERACKSGAQLDDDYDEFGLWYASFATKGKMPYSDYEVIYHYDIAEMDLE